MSWQLVSFVILGLVLGPMLEAEFRRALIASRGDWSVFVERPMAAAILALSLLLVAGPLILRLVRPPPVPGQIDGHRAMPRLLQARPQRIPRPGTMTHPVYQHELAFHRRAPCRSETTRTPR